MRRGKTADGEDVVLIDKTEESAVGEDGADGGDGGAEDNVEFGPPTTHFSSSACSKMVLCCFEP